ncbi:Putative GATA domain-containing protein [Rhizopus microsporus]|nr:Putative GATA domain-containing protein [Rhizopus microsporus]
MDSSQVVEISNLASQALTARSTQTSVPSGPPEFTRRKNWSQNILEELRDIIHVLSLDFNILFCSPASREFLGYQQGELMGRNFKEFIHVDDIDVFTREFRLAHTNGSILRSTLRFRRKDGKHVTLEIRGHFYKNAFFGSARSVPTEMTRTMDAFLNVKMENEILRRKLQLAKAQAAKKTVVTVPQIPQEDEYDDFEEDFEQLFTAVSNPNVYTQGVLNSFGVAESVNLFTGLQFDLGERSRGISMGLEGELFNTTHPPEIGDEATNETNKLKRRGTDDQPRICTDCGRTDAPEWRRGPKGPKTLCNACGLRWSKANKLQTTENNIEQ